VGRVVGGVIVLLAMAPQAGEIVRKMCLQRQEGGLKEGRPVSFMVPIMVWDGVDGVKIIIFSPT
jgi:hypothetical protein